MRWYLFFQKLLDALLFSNVFIACCAVAQGGLTYLLLPIPVNYTLLAILGCATLAMYNFSMMLARPAHPERSPYRRVRWIFQHERSLWGWTGAALMVLTVLGFTLHGPSFALLAVIGVLAAAYNLPIFRKDKAGGRGGLRQFHGLKLFYIGFIWSASVVLLPVAEAYHDGAVIPWPQVWTLMAWIFLFVVAITIPFDIRDVYQDRFYGLKTIPVLLGEWWALVLSTSLLAVLGCWVAASGYPLSIRLHLLGATLLTSIAVSFSRNRKSPYYYFLVLDGMLILLFLAVWVAIAR